MEHGHESPVQIDVSAEGAVVTVVVAGELDITTATNLIRRLLTIGAAHPERLVLDLSGLVFVDVTGARALHDAHTRLQTVCPVILREPRPSVRKIFGSLA
jgi:anti-anti-sigma factor